MEVTNVLVLMLELLAIAALIGLLANVLGGMRPYEQINYASVKSLQSGINQVCQSGDSVEMTINMPQSTPMDLRGVVRTVTEFILKQKGDPEHLLYYESFPPGEGFGWEVYQDLPWRILVPYNNPEFDNPQTDDFSRRHKQVKEFLDSRYSEPYSLGITNVILDDVGEDFSSSPLLKGSVGNWEGSDYRFSKYLSLSTVEKSLIKYRPCGENSLCYKTTQGVKKFPLDYCDNIEDVRLEWDDLTGRGSGELPNFYLASPCKVKVRISKKPVDECGECDQYIKYPLYEYNKSLDKIEEVGDHVQCTSRLDKGDEAPSTEASGECIEVEFIEDPEGFCVLSQKMVVANKEELEEVVEESGAAGIARSIASGVISMGGWLSSAFPGGAASQAAEKVKDKVENIQLVSPLFSFSRYDKTSGGVYLTKTDFDENSLFWGMIVKAIQAGVDEDFLRWSWPHSRAGA